MFLPFLFQSALGFEYKGEVEKHSSQKGKSMGTCGPFTVCPASLLLPVCCAVCCGTVSFVIPFLSLVSDSCSQSVTLAAPFPAVLSPPFCCTFCLSLCFPLTETTS